MPQPPKRKPASSGGGTGSAPKARQSKLAKEHNVTPQEEGEIREAFSLFAEPMDGEKRGVLPIDDVKSALMQVLPTVLRVLQLTLPCALAEPSACQPPPRRN